MVLDAESAMTWCPPSLHDGHTGLERGQDLPGTTSWYQSQDQLGPWTKHQEHIICYTGHLDISARGSIRKRLSLRHCHCSLSSSDFPSSPSCEAAFLHSQSTRSVAHLTHGCYMSPPGLPEHRTTAWAAWTTEMSRLTVLEARSPRSRCWQGHPPSEGSGEGSVPGLSWLVHGHLLLTSLCIVSCPFVSLCLSPHPSF